jgi:hypothetical protein
MTMTAHHRGATDRPAGPRPGLRPAIAWLAIVACAGPACERQPVPAPVATPGSTARSPGAPWLREEAAARGLGFRHTNGAAGRYFLPEIMIGGAALLDVDTDGDLDAYLVQGGSLTEPPERREGNRLYRNRGDGIFDDVTEGSGADDRGYGMGVATGDVDNDGDVDLYVTNVGANALLVNDGTGRFTDVTARAGVGDPGWGASAGDRPTRPGRAVPKRRRRHVHRRVRGGRARRRPGHRAGRGLR